MNRPYPPRAGCPPLPGPRSAHAAAALRKSSACIREHASVNVRDENRGERIGQAR